jgi:S-adenosylmethionine decarboxylase
MIGVHLMLDGVFEPPLGEEEITEILLGLPSEIDMKILAGPMVVRGAEENPGWTGFVIIDASHIAIHAFDEGSRVSIDVFSCKPFQGEKALRYIRERIRFKKHKVQIIERSEE